MQVLLYKIASNPENTSLFFRQECLDESEYVIANFFLKWKSSGDLGYLSQGNAEMIGSVRVWKDGRWD